MSTQVLENETAQATELTAEAVKNALSSRPPQSATRLYPFTITVSEKFGRAFISWQLDPNYAMGPGDVVQLREGERMIGNWRAMGLSGEVDTGRNWGSGLNASYWSRNYLAGDWRQLVVTQNT
jgi:hypothetical protein